MLDKVKEYLKSDMELVVRKIKKKDEGDYFLILETLDFPKIRFRGDIRKALEISEIKVSNK